MPLRIYDFRCPKDHVTEQLVEADTPHIRCKCGEEASRVISGVNFSLDGSDPAWPTAHDRWVREHESAGKIKR